MEIELIIIIISIILSAFFSGMEIAFVSANKMHIELEKKREGFIPRLLTKITQKSSKFITTMLVGNNISLVIYSYYMGKFLIRILPLDSFNDFTVLLIQTIISTIIILITAEFLPKAIFRIYANEVLKIFAFPAYVFYYLFHFFSEFITIISDFFLKVFFKTDSDEQQTAFSKEELGNYINEQLETGNDDDEMDSEIQIFQNALEFQNVKAREVMVPRTEIVSVEMHETVTNLKNIFIDTGLSKILVYKTSLDDIVGYVNAFELFKKPKTIKSILLPLELVPESMMINDILNTLMKKRKSVAVVVDDISSIDPETSLVVRTPWSDDELQRLTLLVRDAVGFNPNRGDSINVVNTPFALPEPPEKIEEVPFYQQTWFLNLLQPVLVGFFVLLLLLIVVRPILKSLGEQNKIAVAEDAEASIFADETDEISDDQVSLVSAEDVMVPGSPEKIERQLNAIRGLIAEEPERVAQVVKQWVLEE